jgi:hypothetical protein
MHRIGAIYQMYAVERANNTPWWWCLWGELCWCLNKFPYNSYCRKSTRWKFFIPAQNIISLSVRRVFDIASIRVSKISIYYKNCQRVPMLCKHLCTLHFTKARKFWIVAQQITWRHDRNSNKSQLVTLRYSFPFHRKLPRKYLVIRYFEKGVEFSNQIKTP